MKTVRTVVLIGVLTATGAVPVIGQVHKFFSPGTVWTVTMIKMASGMDQSYLQYLDGQFKKAEEAQIKAGFEKSYKILRTMDDGGAWNLLILREYTSLASIETNEDKADTLSQQTEGNDQLPGARQVPRGHRHQVRARTGLEIDRRDPGHRTDAHAAFTLGCAIGTDEVRHENTKTRNSFLVSCFRDFVADPGRY